jgi:hypothetical protein
MPMKPHPDQIMAMWSGPSSTLSAGGQRQVDAGNGFNSQQECPSDNTGLRTGKSSTSGRLVCNLS